MIYFIFLIFYLILICISKKIGFMLYQLLTATIYLVSLSYFQTLDITLGLYVAFAVFPYIKHFKIFIGFGVYLLFYFTVNMLASMALNGVMASVSVFLIRYAGLFIYYYIFRNIDFKKIEKNKNINSNFVRTAVVCEIIIFLIGNSLSTDGRLMLNYQCTVGCIATATILYLAYYLYSKNDHAAETMLCMIILTIIACLSGTRGYIVVSIAVTGISFFMKGNTGWRVVLVLIAVLALLFTHQYLLDFILENLRMGSGTGRRHSENLFVLQFMWERPIYVWLFGNGFGTSVGNFSIARRILSVVSDSAYTYQVLQTVTGFHNFYVTILYSSGMIGLVMILILYLKMIISSIALKTSYEIKTVMITFLISYAFLLWFRWTATSGILEFAVFAYVIKDIQGGVILLLLAVFVKLFIDLLTKKWSAIHNNLESNIHNVCLLKTGGTL